MEKSALLKKALLLLDKEKVFTHESFICNCIALAANVQDTPEAYANSSALKRWIHSLLNPPGTRHDDEFPSFSYQGWLRRHAGVQGSEIEDNPRKVQKSRALWMKWMIAHWQAKGE